MLPLLVVLLLAVVESCDIQAEVMIESDTKPVFAQFTFHNDSRTELYEMAPKQKPFKIKISGPICNMKPTTLKTWVKRPENPDVPPLGMTFAFLEGVGDISYTVYSEMGPRMGYRAGVFCGFGDCGGHGK